MRVEQIPLSYESAYFLINVNFIGDYKSKRVIGFSQGFSASSFIYSKFLEGIAKQGFLIIAPNINGVRVRNKEGFIYNPYKNSTLNECKVAVRKGLEESLASEALRQINGGYDLVIGHSTGAATIQSKELEYNKTVLINPLLPVKYNAIGFSRASSKIFFNQLLSYKSRAILHALDPVDKSIGSFNLLTNLRNNLNLIQDFVNNKDIGYFYPEKLETDALLLYGGDLQRECDEFFDFGRNKESLSRQFRSLLIKGTKGGHEEVIYNPSFFIDKTLEFII